MEWDEGRGSHKRPLSLADAAAALEIDHFAIGDLVAPARDALADDYYDDA